MKATVERNLQQLRSVDPDCAELLRRTAPAESVSLATSRNGFEVLVARHGERERWLHSRVDPRREATRLTEALPARAGTVVVFGLGAGHHVRALLTRREVQNVLICEPAAELAARAMEVARIGEILADPRVRLLTPCSTERLAWSVGTAHAPLLHGDAAFLPLRGRTDLDPVRFGELQQAARRGVEQALSDYSTQRRFGLRWMHNILVNVASLRLAYTGRFAPVEEPCVVVAAGPSLERFLARGVPDRDRHGDRTILIAADTALPILLQRGIAPDFVLTIDSQLASYHHFVPGFPARTILVADLTASPTALRQTAAPALRVGGHPLAHYLCDHWVRVPELYTFAGSVTHAAIAFAGTELNANVIGLVGADFAYPGAAAYARDSYIHRHVRLHESRLAPAEHAFSAFVYDRARASEADDTTAEIRYGSPLLNGYRGHLDRLTEQIGVSIARGTVPERADAGADSGGAAVGPLPRRAREIEEPVRLPPAAPALTHYLDSLRTLPDPPSGPTIDLTRLPAPEAEIWHTVLPLAAAESAMDPTTGTPLTEPTEALDRARRRAAKMIETALR